MPKLLDLATANGAGAEVVLDGGPKTLTLEGTLDTATVQISYKPSESSVYTDVSSLIFSTNDVKNVQLSAGKIKATVASAGGSTSLTMYIG